MTKPVYSNNFWDQRYAAEDYVYGTVPNLFFKEHLDLLPTGSILLPGEGEGRNAVYAASIGWKVTAFDQSIEGQKKALKLAAHKKVTIDYQLSDYKHFQTNDQQFDCIGLFYTHMSPELRKLFLPQLYKWLKPNGCVILEGFEKAQINNQSGGPKDVQMLFSEDELRYYFKQFSELDISTPITELQEGTFHRGQANLIRLIARK